MLLLLAAFLTRWLLPDWLAAAGRLARAAGGRAFLLALLLRLGSVRSLLAFFELFEKAGNNI